MLNCCTVYWRLEISHILIKFVFCWTDPPLWTATSLNEQLTCALAFTDSRVWEAKFEWTASIKLIHQLLQGWQAGIDFCITQYMHQFHTLNCRQHCCWMGNFEYPCRPKEDPQPLVELLQSAPHSSIPFTTLWMNILYLLNWLADSTTTPIKWSNTNITSLGLPLTICSNDRALTWLKERNYSHKQCHAWMSFTCWVHRYQLTPHAWPREES